MVHGERHNTHVIHVEHTETPYNEMATDPFRDMKSHTTIIDIVFYALNVYVLLDSVVTNTFFVTRNIFFLGPMMTKHIW